MLLIRLYHRSTPLLIVLGVLIGVAFFVARHDVHEARYKQVYGAGR